MSIVKMLWIKIKVKDENKLYFSYFSLFSLLSF